MSHINAKEDYDRFLLRKLPEDVWLEYSMTLVLAGHRAMLRPRDVFGTLEGYLKVDRIIEPLSGIRICEDSYIAIRDEDGECRGFVTRQGRYCDWFDVDLTRVNPETRTLTFVLQDAWGNPYCKYE